MKKKPLINHPGWEKIKDEYDYERNEAEGVILAELGVTYRPKVWWHCHACGDHWKMDPYNRLKGEGCPCCHNRKTVEGINDLATTHPELAAEWHPTLNGNLTPQMVRRGSHKMVYWLCPEGHTWISMVNTRVSMHTICPICTGHQVLAGYNDLATTDPEIAAEWHPTLNGVLRPQDVTRCSSKRVFWTGKCGHTWEAPVAQRTSGKCGCPYCRGYRILVGFNDLATTYPYLAEEWHPTLNGNLTPQQVTKGSMKKVWWLCPDCGHEWKTPVCRRTSGKTGCPKCYVSALEKIVRVHLDSLKEHGFEVKEQWKHPECVDQKMLRFDFAVLVPGRELPVALIECQGRQHYVPVEPFGGEEQLRDQQRKDAIKRRWCMNGQVPLLEIPYKMNGRQCRAALVDFLAVLGVLPISFEIDYAA